jgi:glycolate oxidase iron-sulfur subunit
VSAPAKASGPATHAVPVAGASALPGSPLEQERAGLDACVHCGFCLQACPTYLALEDENDSPRGRLLLMGSLLEGTVAPNDETVGRHLDQCLGCRGCETACPAGVPYGRLLEATRATLIEHRPLPLIARAMLAIFARPWALRPFLAGARLTRGTGIARLLARVLPGRLASPFAILAATARAAVTSWQPRRDATKGRAALLTGCVMEGLFTEVNRATERTLAQQGWDVVACEGQRCCGALHAHAGDAEGARELARTNIAAFEASGAGTIVMNSAGCGAMCKEYAHLLGDDPAWAARAKAFSERVRDVHELLEPPLGGAATASPVSVAYDAPCHLHHGQRVITPPVALLSALPAVSLVPLADSDQCCGSAGIFSLVRPDVAEKVLAPKLARIRESGAAIVATGNPGCLMQIGGGLIRDGGAVVTRHPVELLDAHYARETSRG